MERFFFAALVIISSLQSCTAQDAQQLKGLDVHNQLRAKHRSPPLALDSTLNTLAQVCAQYHADKGSNEDNTCPYTSGAAEHNFGVRTHPGDPIDKVKMTESSIKSFWYDFSVPHYDYNNPGLKNVKARRFAQIVWKSTKKLGIGYAQKGDFHVVVALYSPAGNIPGQYPQNVQKP